MKIFFVLLFLVLPFSLKSNLFENYDITRFFLLNLVLLYLIAVRKGIFEQIQTVTILIFAFYLFNLIQSIFYPNFFDAIYDSQKIVLIVCVLVIFISDFQEEYFKIEVYKSISIGAMVCCIFAIFQLTEKLDFTKENQYYITSFFEHKNVFTSYLFLSFPFTILLYYNSTKGWRYFSIFTFIVSFSFVLILQTRSIYLAIIFCLITFYVLYFRQINQFIKRKYVLFSLAFVILIISATSLNVWNKITISSFTKSESAIERVKVWNKTVQLIAENPIFGVGPGNWKYQYLKYGVGDIESVAFSLVTFQKPHNDFLWILAENGLVGFLLFASILIYILILVVKARKVNLSNTAKICIAFLVGLLADSFFSFPKEKISHILLASIILVVLIAELNPKTYKISILSQKIIRFSFFGILFFSLLISVFRFKGEYYSMKLFQAKHENNYRNLIDFGQKGNSLFYKTNLTSIPLKSYMGYGYNKLGKYDSLFLVSREAYLISPYSFEVLNNYGFILEKFHQYREAKKIMLEAYRINPKNEMTLYNLVVLEFNTKNYQKALFWLTKIRNYKDKYKKTFEKITSNL